MEEKKVKIHHFIQLRSYPNSGKTTTMVWCLLKLLEKSAIKGLKYFELGDFVALVEINGKTIGFVSGGDDGDSVNKNYEILCEMSKGEIEVCVFATRTNGYSVINLEEILQQNGKQEPDEVLRNSWIDIMKETQEEIIQVKYEISCHLQEQSDELIKLIKKYL